MVRGGVREGAATGPEELSRSGGMRAGGRPGPRAPMEVTGYEAASGGGGGAVAGGSAGKGPAAAGLELGR